MDRVLLALKIIGAVVFTIAYVRVLRRMSDDKRWGFGILVVLVPILGLVYALKHWERMWREAVGMLLGAAMIGATIVIDGLRRGGGFTSPWS